ncbi:flagellar hook-associated protein FlgL [Ureibacillus thermophilus]|uniref:Flagellar hook-associated protein FlgL n=1 Tax=Ureibacillus thermophilus TaxID=367743 RepID=A0A4P6UT95_9BACL|nr:flagellar hook-associated protein FlgL [Ureibacillus thermophilus]QBK25341.1 flagellar hook-associated protein FlgL [Ureibacillus thermophilus]
MRVTQSMLSNNMLRNLSNSYAKIGKYQDQITTGRKFTRPSEDPVATVKGMSYRTDLNKTEQFTRNLQTVNTWLDTTDDALDQVGNALQRVKELIVQAANDTNTPDDRQKIQEEINQIKKHLRDLANTKVSDKYIFSGTNTFTPVFDSSGNVNEHSVSIEVFDGITLNVNIAGKTLFGNIDTFMNDFSKTLLDPNSSGEDISKKLGDLDNHISAVLAARADVGARQNRVELMTNRLSSHEINITKRLSENEDVDYAEAITKMITSESIHQAALSVGAKIIQQTLVDFIR